ncbi:hypothetical protein Zm00014a_019509 [Zea mays]|uniref:RING-type E3 ubiquitin transferase n=1 Tax=Zea mays TaxID=4577 RepID=A0A3L6FFX8_MAIZE|nr:hypothetical protein Zm00014a_019509 [Zea mays]
MDAAEAVQRLADLEAQRRHNTEVRVCREADVKVCALDAISSHDFRYRKYHINEIEMATERFSDDLQFGEGEYDSVYRASMGSSSRAPAMPLSLQHRPSRFRQLDLKPTVCLLRM